MKSSSGLTLLEILIAITLFAGIAAILVAAVRTGLRAADSGVSRIASLERDRAVADLLRSQIESAVVPLSPSRKQNAFRGDRLSLAFPASMSIWDGAGGNVMIEYRIEPDKGGLRLAASETVIGTEQRREAVLLKGLTEAGFAYASAGDDPGENDPGRWEERWSRDRTLPRKVRITLKDKLNQREMIIPVRTGEN